LAASGPALTSDAEWEAVMNRWYQIQARKASVSLRCHRPRKRTIQYAVTAQIDR
jgi:hypothetical protein